MAKIERQCPFKGKSILIIPTFISPSEGCCCLSYFYVLILLKLLVISSSNISSYLTLILILRLNLLLVFQVYEPLVI